MLVDKVRDKIKSVLDKFGEELESFKVERAPENFGELASNVAFLLAKKLKKNPREIAERIALEFEKDESFDKCEVAGPGFLNFVLSRSEHVKVIEKILDEGENYGRSEKKHMKVQFEFASANPTGPLTVGHGRQAVIGDVLSRIYSFLGYEVQKEMYINDAGRQIDLLGYSLWIRYNQLLGVEGLEIPEDGYRGEYLVDMARELIEEIGERYKNVWNDEVREFFKSYALERNLKSMKATLKRLGIEFDNYFSEKSLIEDGTVDEVLRILNEKGHIYEKDGAVWFRASNFIDDSDKVLVKSDGSFTYFLTDIAYHLNKFRRGFDRIYDIFGSDHHGHEPRLQAALKALGIPDGFLKVIFHQYVTLKRGREIVKMSTRKGEFVTLDELIDAVGVDAVRYFFCMMDPNTHLNFDMELATKKSEDNPVYYIQYSYARIRSIFRKSEEKGIKFEPGKGLEKLGNSKERTLTLSLAFFPQALEEAAEEFAPNKLTNYLVDLAARFHSFYTENVVLDPENPELSQGRLNLCKAVEIVMRNALNLLGVSCPERM
ncbi:MAG: arginine--tRNA ligase [Thermotogae bacterium]|nr:arginine--tRNA ligase [Thermotogota bacterium]